MKKTTLKRIMFIGVMVVILSMVMVFTVVADNRSYAASQTPGKVTLTKISSSAYNKVTINWEKTSNATNYKIYYKKSGASKWIGLKTVGSGNTSYTHTASSSKSIVVGQKYVYTVRGYNSKSKKSGSYNTKGLAVATKPNTVKLGKVSLNSAKTQATVTWSKTGGANQYLVYRKTPGTGWKKLATVNSSTLKYTDKAPVKGQTNTYTVKSYYSKTKVYGKYNSKGISVVVPKPTAPKPELSATATNVSMKEAETKSVSIKYTGNNTIRYNIANTNIVSCRWDEGWDNDTTKLYITGENAGTTTVRITDIVTNDYIIITVRVIAPKIELSATVTDISMKEAETQNTVIKYTGKGSLAYDIADTNVVSCRLEKNWNDDTSKLYITGENGGTTTVKITNSLTEDYIIITVRVICPITIALPTVPQTITDYLYNGRIKAICDISKVYYTLNRVGSSYRYNIYVDGKKTYDRNGDNKSSSCRIY